MNYPLSYIEYCVNAGLRLTSLRKSVLYILWDSSKPLKAYEILDLLLKNNQNSKAPTVYRVLDYFVLSGIVHKIESIQSYTLCHEPKKHLPSEILMVCNRCHHVREVYEEKMRTLVQQLTSQQGFQLSGNAIELKGFCAECRSVDS